MTEGVSMKTFILLILIGLFLAGCSSAPIATNSLLKQETPTNTNMHYTFTDARDEDFRTMVGCFGRRTDYGGVQTCPDSAYDKPLNKVFQEMFLARFPAQNGGYSAEIKLIAFNYDWRPNPAEGLAGMFFGPLGVLVAHATEPKAYFYGICKVDIAVSDKNQIVFNKTYNIMIEERKLAETHKTTTLEILRKAFDKFAGDFETDIKALRID